MYFMHLQLASESAAFSFGDFRQSLLPMNLEMQLFLKMNKRFWDEQILASIVA